MCPVAPTPACEYLELLAREAAAIEFEAPLAQARTRGADPAELADLEAAKLAALRVRSLLERRRRREDELSALFDTANDLAGLHDLDAVLHAIVHRARTLLGTDVAYMMLNDEQRGDTYIRVTDGSTSARFQALRLSLGVGLGGLVAQRGTAYFTDNYPADQRFRHTGEIDAGVEEEGLVAILGVPMRLGSRVIGVLLAANRSVRPFAPEEVSLLLSLAAHAAVAIDAAALLAGTRAALDELSQANAVIRAHSESIERAAAAHERMTAVVLRGGGVAEVAAAVTEVLGGALVVLDAAGRPLAEVPAPAGDPPAGPVPDQVLAAVARSRQARQAVPHDGYWVAAVVAGSADLGALVLYPAGALDDAGTRILERAALVTALLLLFRRTVAEAEGRVRGELLDELISRPVRDAEALRARAGRLGVALDGEYALVVVRDDRLAGAGRARALSWAGSYAAARGGLAADREHRVVLLLPGTDPGPAARAIARDLGRILGHPVTAGAAGPVRPPHGIAAGYRDADRAAAALVALDRAGTGAAIAELGFAGLLLGEERDVAGFLAGTIGPVLAYDQRRGTALTRTLAAYFGAGASLSRAAEVLHVHVNTMTQRLDRVAQLLGPDWQAPDRALEIQLALRLHRMRTGGAGTG